MKTITEHNDDTIEQLKHFAQAVLPDLQNHNIVPTHATVASVDKRGRLRMSKGARWACKQVKKARERGGTSEQLAVTIAERLLPDIFD